MWKYQNSDELCHHGILGMKWGIRRYQNKDGSLTNAGRKHQRNMSQDAKEAYALKKKKVSEMSNAELRKLNERKNLERNYKQLNPNAVTKGLAIVGTTAAALGAISGIQKNGTKIIKNGKVIAQGVVKALKK